MNKAVILLGFGAVLCLAGIVLAAGSQPASASGLPAETPLVTPAMPRLLAPQLQATALPQAEKTGSFMYLPAVFRGLETPTPTTTPDPTTTPEPTPTATATEPQPTPVGPLGGTFTSLAIDPNQNDTLYAGSYTAGVFKSFDRGLNWYAKSVGLDNLQIQSLAAHPSSSMIVYAGTYTSGVYKTEDGGETWHAVNGGTLDKHIVYDIEIDPESPDTLYAATRVKGSLVGYLARSLDAGLSWTILLRGNVFSSDDYFYDVDINPKDTDVIYLSAHEHGFYKSTNGGVSFTAINTGISDLSARSTVLDPAKPSLVFGGVWHDDGCFMSSDGGANWSRRASGLPVNVKIMRLYMDPFGGAQKRVLACTFGNGLYSSDNSGTSWTSRGLNGQSLNDFIIADGDPQRWYAALQDNGLRKSSNYGSTWVGSTGTLRLNTITGLVSLPAVPEAVFAAIYGRGVYLVSDSGQTWTEFNTGLPDLGVTQLVNLGDALYALTDSGLYLRHGNTWENLGLPQSTSADKAGYVDWLDARVNVPDDLALEALQADTAAEQQLMGIPHGLPLTALVALDGRLIGGTAGQGLWCWDGRAWAACGLDGHSIRALASDPSKQQVLVYSCSSPDACAMRLLNADGVRDINTGLEGLSVNGVVSAGGRYYALSSAGLYTWDEGLSVWHHLGLAGKNVLSLAISPDASCRMAVGTQNEAYLSTDCGQSWRLLSAKLGDWHYQALNFDPKDPGLILLGSREAGAFMLALD